MWAILWLLGALSLVLALFNLLPVLPLDGGHAVVVIYEGIASKVKHHRVFVDYRKLIPISVRGALAADVPGALGDGARHPPARQLSTRRARRP